MDPGLPPDFWAEICTLVRTDDGRTGRSLSLVSRYVNEVSKPYKLQSVAVAGSRQLLAFASLIESLPPLLRRVTCIFLSHRTPVIPSNDTKPDFSVSSNEKWHEGYEAIMRVLRVIAPYVRIVHWSLLALVEDASVLLEVSLPVLEELVLDGPAKWPRYLPQLKAVRFPALKRLDVTSPPFEPTHIIETICSWMPCLTHLRLSASLRREGAPWQWCALTEKIKDKPLPTHLETIYVRAPPCPGDFTLHREYEQVMGYIKNLAEM